jgi:hypothetical protein
MLTYGHKIKHICKMRQNMSLFAYEN